MNSESEPMAWGIPVSELDAKMLKIYRRDLRNEEFVERTHGARKMFERIIFIGIMVYAGLWALWNAWVLTSRSFPMWGVRPMALHTFELVGYLIFFGVMSVRSASANWMHP